MDDSNDDSNDEICGLTTIMQHAYMVKDTHKCVCKACASYQSLVCSTVEGS